MWIFSRYGMFSVTNARLEAGRGALDPDRLQVRARSRRHLEMLMARFPALAGLKVIETPHADYLFRIVVLRTVWVAVVGALATEIAYPNFKDACVASGELEREYIEMLHEVWGVANDLQGILHGCGAYVWPKEGEIEFPREEDSIASVRDEALAERQALKKSLALHLPVVAKGFRKLKQYHVDRLTELSFDGDAVDALRALESLIVAVLGVTPDALAMPLEGLGTSDIAAERDRLREFVAALAWCPCCETTTEPHDAGCTYLQDCPEEYADTEFARTTLRSSKGDA